MSVWDFRDFTFNEIDQLCADYGPPEYRQTEDGEGWYWCFAGHDLPVADNLSELLLAGRQLWAENRPASPDPNSNDSKR